MPKRRLFTHFRHYFGDFWQNFDIFDHFSGVVGRGPCIGVKIPDEVDEQARLAAIGGGGG